MDYRLVPKLPGQKASIFSVMSAMARQAGAINLSQGYPDFGIDSRLIEYVNEAMKKELNQYAPMPGIAALREQIRHKTFLLHGRQYDVDEEITVVPGATLGIYAAITATIHHGDEVIILDPAYDSYEPSVVINGGRTRRIALNFPDFSVDWDRIRHAINPNTRLIVINNPHNPTGAVLTREDLDELWDIVKDSRIWVLSDEVYEHIVFDGKQHVSVASHPGLADRTFITASFGKTYHTTGWKMGYVLAPADMTRMLRSVYQFMAFSAHYPTQYAFAKMLEDSSTYSGLGAFYQRKRDLFRELIKESRFEIFPSYGSYFQLLGYRNISEESDIAFAERLTKEYKVAAIPTSVFYGDGTDHKLLRFCFAKRDETLEDAAAILCKI